MLDRELVDSYTRKVYQSVNKVTEYFSQYYYLLDSLNLRLPGMSLYFVEIY